MIESMFNKICFILYGVTNIIKCCSTSHKGGDLRDLTEKKSD